RTVNVRRIKKCDPEFERAMHRRDRFFVVAVAIEIGHAHATETDSRNTRSAASEFSLFHMPFVMSSEVETSLDISEQHDLTIFRDSSTSVGMTKSHLTWARSFRCGSSSPDLFNW